MPTYSAFGLILRSEVHLSDAEPIDDSRFDCVLERRSEAAPTVVQTKLGEEVVTTDVMVRSYETGAGYRLAYDDTGTFDVSFDGTRITWWSGGVDPNDAVLTDILGRVLSFALHARGVLTLHASAVDLDGEGLAFLAPKFFGKSTLAAALVRSGARLITDDTLAVDPGHPPLLRAGVQSIRLREDSATSVAVPFSDPRLGGKTAHRPAAVSSVGKELTPLRAAYRLAPAPGDGRTPAASRTRCSATEGALTFITYRKLGQLLDGRAAARSFAIAAALADTVPVYDLSITRRLDQLEEVVALIREWHVVAPAARDLPAESRVAEG